MNTFESISLILSSRKIVYGILLYLLIYISVLSFVFFYLNSLGTSYNDARSHLDIGRRVVEGLKPGLAQLGSVWLPLPHILIALTVWNDFFWHTGLSGAIVSMLSFVATGILIYKFLEKMGVGIFGRLIGVFVFASNLNILYLQSTAMTELLLIATMTAGAYELLAWHIENKLFSLMKAAFWIMLSTLVRYDGWFLFVVAAFLVGTKILVSSFSPGQKKNLIQVFSKKYSELEGVLILFSTLAGFGIFLWFVWNLAIFKDPFYFAFGPYSAHAQQTQLEGAGNLDTKYNLYLSVKMYLYALVYNSGIVPSILGLIGALVLWFDKRLNPAIRLASIALLAPLLFNIVALFFGHSVLFIKGLSGDTWFNVRYGVMMMSSLAVFIGYLSHKMGIYKWLIIIPLITASVIPMTNLYAVTIEDARVGSSQKNVSEVSSWLNAHAKDQKGFIVISAASHDAIIFSSNLPMSRFIHEGTGKYWDFATEDPTHWARWIVMRTYDDNDQTYRLIKNSEYKTHYNLVGNYPFADIYELKPEYVSTLQTEAVITNQK